jgi:hypothetical protein
VKRSWILLFLWACEPASSGVDGAVDGSIFADAAPDPDLGFAADSEVDAGPRRITALSAARISSQSGEPNFHTVTATVDFGAGPFSSARVTAELGTTCVPFESWADNPPPPGHNWPADCDAFDRNFEISLERTGQTPIELIRAITPFGGPLTVEADITDLVNGLPGVHRARVTIPTYSDATGRVSGANGGWNVSLTFDLVPGAPPKEVLAVVPLFYLDHRDTTPDTSYPFVVPAGATGGRIEYRATGHGGGAAGPSCIGPAEEFCRRRHDFYFDGNPTPIAELDAWRTDCDQLCTLAHYGPSSGGFDYCLENPCGAIASVRAPRANWCPGSVTPPLILDLFDYGPGPHDFRYAIPGALPGGLWRVSALYVGWR